MFFCKYVSNYRGCIPRSGIADKYPLKRASKQAKCKCQTKADSPERKMGEIAASKHLFVKWGRVSGGLSESGWKREEIGKHTARPFSSLWHRPQLNGCRK